MLLALLAVLPHFTLTSALAQQRVYCGSGDFGPYMAYMHRRIMSHWTEPATEKWRTLTLHFKLTEEGIINEPNIQISSGIEEIDKAAIETVKKSAPFNSYKSPYRPAEVDIEYTFEKHADRKTIEKCSDEQAQWERLHADLKIRGRWFPSQRVKQNWSDYEHYRPGSALRAPPIVEPVQASNVPP
jgi:TonB family protein